MAEGITINSGRDARLDEAAYVKQVYKPKTIDITKSMQWEVLYQEECNQFDRKVWFYMIICAAVILGRIIM